MIFSEDFAEMWNELIAPTVSDLSLTDFCGDCDVFAAFVMLLQSVLLL